MLNFQTYGRIIVFSKDPDLDTDSISNLESVSVKMNLDQQHWFYHSAVASAAISINLQTCCNLYFCASSDILVSEFHNSILLFIIVKGHL